MKISRSFRLRIFICAIAVLPCLLAPISLRAQNVKPVQDVVGEPWRGEPAVTEVVADIMARQSLAVAQPRRIARVERKRFEKFRPPKRPNPAAPRTGQWPPQAQHVEPSLGPFNPQIVGANFLGVDFFDTVNFLVVPPDSIGAVGPSQVFVVTNGQMKVFEKTGLLGSLNVDLDTFFASVLTPAQFTSDPHVRFDRLSQRWFVTAISIIGDDPEPPNRILIAVSSGPTITSNSSFSFFQFQHDQVGGTNPDVGGFADYDTLGVDKFALYIGVNVFKATTLTTTGFVVNKSNLINGTLTVFPFRSLGSFLFSTQNGGGMDTPQGVHNDDPNATEGYFIGVDMTAFSKLNLRRVSNPGGTPSISASDIVVQAVPSTAFPLDQVQSPGPGIKSLDAVSDRLFAASIHTNKLTGVRSLWTAHNIEVDSSGTGVAGGGRNGSRWYEIRNLTTTPTVQQAGTLFDPSSTNPFGYWVPSVAMSGQGHMAMGASRASNSDTEGLAGVAVAGRLSSDPLGTTQAPTLAQAGQAQYTFSTSDPVQRWGDYSQTVVDPADDMTMWTFQEYTSANGRWSVRAVQLMAPPPATPVSASPAVVPQGQTGVNITVTGASSAGSGFFDPGSGFPNHITATVSGVTVIGTTFNDPNSVTATISTVCATGGPRDVTITNPDGQSATGAGLLTVGFLPTTTSLSTTSNPGFVGQAVTLTATVNSSTACPAPTGTLTFREGATTLGSGSLAGGQATFTTSTLSAGVHNITAQYGGDARYSGSTSSALSQSILFATSTSLSSSQNPSALGGSVTFTATVANLPAGGPVPGGTVGFTDNGSPAGPPVSLSGGVATRSITFSSAISHFIVATYSGDSIHSPSTSVTFHQRVQAPGVGVSVGSNLPDPVNVGMVVTIATVVTNTGGSSNTYSFTQSLAGNFVFVSASATQGTPCSAGGAPFTVTCPLGTITAGGSATITTLVRALVGHDIIFTNSATATGGTTFTTNKVRVRFRPFKF